MCKLCNWIYCILILVFFACEGDISSDSSYDYRHSKEEHTRIETRREVHESVRIEGDKVDKDRKVLEDGSKETHKKEETEIGVDHKNRIRISTKD